MSDRRVALVADPSHFEIVRAICSRFENVGVFNPTRSRFGELSSPIFTDLESLLRQFDPALCCFLSPYTRMKQDLPTCIDRRVHVLSAGPFSLNRKEFELVSQEARDNRIHVQSNGRHLFSRLHDTVSERSGGSAFGHPVYLRLLTGGGDGILSAWWAACEALAQAESLLRSGVTDLRVTAIKKGRKHHVTLTGQMGDRALAQLVIAPVHMPLGRDLTLLGTGGLLLNESIHNATTVIKKGGVELHSHDAFCPDPDWLRDFVEKIDRSDLELPDWETVSFQGRVLRSIRQGIREGRPVRVKV